MRSEWLRRLKRKGPFRTDSIRGAASPRRKKAELCKEAESTLDIGDLRRPESIENTAVKYEEHVVEKDQVSTIESNEEK